jgi:plasmid stability protein
MEITVSVDDQLAERARLYAETHGTSVDQMVREYLAQVTEAVAKDAKAEADELVRLFQEAKGNSGDWKFNREEIYEERLKWPRS